MKTLPIHETFHTFQGEGVHMGKPAFFIRTFGCPVHCPWCDSAGTWHPDYVPVDIARLSTEDLVLQVLESGAPFAVLTGGEPAVHDLTEVTRALRSHGIRVHLETSGAFPLKGRFDWITLSPKRWKMPLMENVTLADEFKIIVETGMDDIVFYYTYLTDKGLREQSRPIWLHPEWSQRDNPSVLSAISETVKSSGHGADFRAGWQLHKLYKVDLADKRSRLAVPLGGNPKLGY